ncbi:hypothetical protein WBW50_24720, partial [Escherichia marmotae]|uniref:hypothetical protein n=1 Tax=Escherichia marmotae TaxID=1499973 RepID=UPI003D175932
TGLSSFVYCLPSATVTDACPGRLAAKNKDKARSALAVNFAGISVMFTGYINQNYKQWRPA